MRVWDIPVTKLCDKHLVAQHHEIHCIYNIITKGLKGFSNHPEVNRWRGKILALWVTHEVTVAEMLDRGLSHNSPVPDTYIYDGLHIVTGTSPEPWQPIPKQLEVLRAKGCECEV